MTVIEGGGRQEAREGRRERDRETERQRDRETERMLGQQCGRQPSERVRGGTRKRESE